MKIPLLAILFSALAFPQVPALQSAVPLPTPKVQILDASGRPCAGCYLWTYAAGTSTPQATYTDSTAGTSNTNPVVLDAGGAASVWIAGQAYKLVLEKPPFVAGHGSVVWTVDNVTDTTFFYLTYLRSISDSALLTYTSPGTGGASRTVRAKLTELGISVKDFGAKCDGLTDDSAAFEAALDYAATVGYPKVVFPAGVCLGNMTLYSYQSIEGASSSGPNPGYTATSGTTIQDASGGTLPVIAVNSGAAHVGVKNVNLRGNGSGSADRGIYAPSMSYSNVEGLGCDNFGEECVRWEAGPVLRLVSVFATNTLLNRTRYTYTGVVYFGGTDGYLRDAELTASISREGHSISSDCFNTALYLGGANHFVDTIQAEISEYGIYATGTVHRLANVRSDLNYCAGALWAASGGQVVNSLFLRNGRDGAGTWPGVEVTGVNNLFSNNLIDQTSGVNLTGGFDDQIIGDTNTNIYTANKMVGSTGYLYDFASTAASAFFTPEKDPVSIADGTSSPDLSNYQTFKFLQSSPITISTFAGGLPGQRACLFGNTNVTISQGGNIYLATLTASTELMEANRLYCFQRVGTNWFQIGTSRNPTFQRLDATDTVYAPIYIGTGTAPAAVAGAALGTSGSITVSGSNTYGYILFQAAGTSIGSGTMGTLTWSGTYPSAKKCVLQAANSPAATVRTYFDYGSPAETVLVLKTPDTLTNNNYGWFYHCGH